jgi:hypothetical protein
MHVLATANDGKEVVSDFLAREARAQGFEVTNRAWADNEKRVVVGGNVLSVKEQDGETVIMVAKEDKMSLPNSIKESIESQFSSGGSTGHSSTPTIDVSDTPEPSTETSDTSRTSTSPVNKTKDVDSYPKMELYTYWEVSSSEEAISEGSVEGEVEAVLNESYQNNERITIVKGADVELRSIAPTTTEMAVVADIAGAITQETIEDISDGVFSGLMAWSSSSGGGANIKRVSVNGAEWDITGPVVE